MAVIRVNKTADFTVMSNMHFKEREMSLKAKGLLSLMLSLPNEWDYSVSGLVTLSKDGKDSTTKALMELEKYGYVRRIRATDNKGRFIGYDYDIYEKPQTEIPETENPLTENPSTENPPQLNTNKLTTKQSNTKELKTKEISLEFETLWKLYPRKIGKPKALKAYQKARKNGVTLEQVQQGIEAYNAQIKAQETETEYIKHGSTWFYNECWNDEYKTKEKEAPEYEGLNGGLTI